LLPRTFTRYTHAHAVVGFTRTIFLRLVTLRLRLPVTFYVLHAFTFRLVYVTTFCRFTAYARLPRVILRGYTFTFTVHHRLHGLRYGLHTLGCYVGCWLLFTVYVTVLPHTVTFGWFVVAVLHVWLRLLRLVAVYWLLRLITRFTFVTAFVHGLRLRSPLQFTHTHVHVWLPTFAFTFGCQFYVHTRLLRCVCYTHHCGSFTHGWLRFGYAHARYGWFVTFTVTVTLPRWFTRFDSFGYLHIRCTAHTHAHTFYRGYYTVVHVCSLRFAVLPVGYVGYPFRFTVYRLRLVTLPLHVYVTRLRLYTFGWFRILHLRFTLPHGLWFYGLRTHVYAVYLRWVHAHRTVCGSHTFTGYGSRFTARFTHLPLVKLLRFTVVAIYYTFTFTTHTVTVGCVLRFPFDSVCSVGLRCGSTHLPFGWLRFTVVTRLCRCVAALPGCYRLVVAGYVCGLRLRLRFILHTATFTLPHTTFAFWLRLVGYVTLHTHVAVILHRWLHTFYTRLPHTGCGYGLVTVGFYRCSRS